jgi:phage regulator Rha-like protein
MLKIGGRVLTQRVPISSDCAKLIFLFQCHAGGIMDAIVPMEVVKSRIYLLRGQKVLLDSDLAELYGVGVKVLNQAVKRNISRFPTDFMFQLSTEEFAGLSSLRSQFVTLKDGRGAHRKYLPYAFTEQGIAMLSSVLNTERAVQVNIAIMRAFVQMRELAMSNRELARKLDELEKKHAHHDRQFVVVFDAIRQLMTPVEKPGRKKIGFGQEDED